MRFLVWGSWEALFVSGTHWISLSLLSGVCVLEGGALVWNQRLPGPAVRLWVVEEKVANRSRLHSACVTVLGAALAHSACVGVLEYDEQEYVAACCLLLGGLETLGA